MEIRKQRHFKHSEVELVANGLKPFAVLGDLYTALAERAREELTPKVGFVLRFDTTPDAHGVNIVVYETVDQEAAQKTLPNA